ncbi:MAG: RHS repeat-associated core domain-containing protein [Victivallaceae bacterium]|nr:RHS repeat-associated core domain-containing protein [Victivallaceae bacterium]
MEFAYDYLGRRIEKKFYSGNTLNARLKFVYYGYKLVAELNGMNSNTLVRRYTWNAGITGLDTPLEVRDAETDTTYFHRTDANKNVVALTTSTAVAAWYEYDPYGKVISSTGDFAETNPLRFSSEYADSETGLVYYNYRYYTPAIGRWLSKDPIAENGGVNLYNFLENDPVNVIDSLGLQDSIHWDSYWQKLRDNKLKNLNLTPEQLWWAEIQLARGCIGVVCANLGAREKHSNCYKLMSQAQQRQQEMSTKCECGKNSNPQIYSIHLGNSPTNPPVSFDPATGKADLGKWNPDIHKKPGHVNFDYGLYDPTSSTMTHADMYHNPDRDGNGVGDYFYDPNDPNNPNSPLALPIRETTIYKSSMSEWQASYSDFNEEVWCVQCDGGSYGK